MTGALSLMVDYLGWAATAVFVGSYFCTRPPAMKRVQMVGALMWTAYGAFIGASPVVVANLLVLGAAAWSMKGEAGRSADGIHQHLERLPVRAEIEGRPPLGDRQRD